MISWRFDLADWIAVIVVAMALLFLSVNLVCAHDDQHVSDWIRNDGLRDPVSGTGCCGFDDCHITTAVNIVHNGYLLTDTRELVPFARAITNRRDGNYWRCDNHDKKVRCLIVPPPTM